MLICHDVDGDGDDEDDDYDDDVESAWFMIMKMVLCNDFKQVLKTD